MALPVRPAVQTVRVLPVVPVVILNCIRYQSATSSRCLGNFDFRVRLTHDHEYDAGGEEGATSTTTFGCMQLFSYLRVESRIG